MLRIEPPKQTDGEKPRGFGWALVQSSCCLDDDSARRVNPSAALACLEWFEMSLYFTRC